MLGTILAKELNIDKIFSHWVKRECFRMNGVVPPLEKLIVRGVLGEDNMVFSLCSYYMAKGNSLLLE